MPAMATLNTLAGCERWRPLRGWKADGQIFELIALELPLWLAELHNEAGYSAFVFFQSSQLVAVSVQKDDFKAVRGTS